METINLGGKDRPITINLNVVSAIEEHLGVSWADGSLFKALGTASALRRLIYLALAEATIEGVAPLTESEVGAMITMYNLPGIMQQVGDSLREDFMGLQGTTLAPFVPTPKDIIHEAFKLVELQPGETVLDIGCGTGDALLIAGAEFKAGRLIGYETHEERARMARQRLSELGVPAEVKLEDGTQVSPEDLYAADVVFLYLLASSNEMLRPMLEVSLAPGTRVVSHDFPMRWKGWRTKELEVPGNRAHNLYAYLIGEHTEVTITVEKTLSGQKQLQGIPSGASFGTGGSLVQKPPEAE